MNAHAILGLIALIFTLFVGITGFITAGMMQCYDGDNEWGERDKVYKVAKVHRYSSYIMLLFGNGVCSGGVATYFSKIGYGVYGTFGVSTSIFFLLMVAVHECMMRRYNRRNFKLVEGEQLLHMIADNDLKAWTPLEIEQAVEGGDTLVICDNLVLRTDGYEKIHPGGKFTIRKNFGRDIAKFYYGNYALTNGMLTTPHTHGGQANLILRSMIVGVIEDQHDAVEEPTKIFAKHELTDNIATFTFKKLDGKKVRNFKGWYFDLGMVAKHFTVSSLALPHIKRQYTICQTMEVQVLKALYKLAKDILDSGPGSHIRLDENLFNSDDTNKISLTMKDYKRPSGLATQIFNVQLLGYQQFEGDKVLIATMHSSNKN